jgi:hypothetical protein
MDATYPLAAQPLILIAVFAVALLVFDLVLVRLLTLNASFD